VGRDGSLSRDEFDAAADRFARACAGLGYE
jgi:hypothetical protein